MTDRMIPQERSPEAFCPTFLQFSRCLAEVCSYLLFVRKSTRYKQMSPSDMLAVCLRPRPLHSD